MCLLTTKKTIIAVLIFSFLVDQMLQIFGNVIALRTSHDIYKYLTCLTEDDGSAFVLNNNLIQPYPAESYFKLRLCKLLEQNQIFLYFYNRINMMFESLMEYFLLSQVY